MPVDSRHLRTTVIVIATLATGAAIFFAAGGGGEPDRHGKKTPASSAAGTVAPPGSAAAKSPPSASPFVPPLSLEDAERLTTSEIALQLAGWPEGAVHPDLPRWVALLASRGDGAVPDLSSALATAGSNTARGVLADSLARIGTDTAIQELCTHGIQAPDEDARRTIAESFRALSRPGAAPMLASLFSQVSAGPLVTEAAAALRRLTDSAGVHSLADMCQEGGQLYSERAHLFAVLSALENPEALPALETLAADTSDAERAAAAATGVGHLKAAAAARKSPQ